MKRLIFIGRTGEDTVYFNFKTHRALIVRNLKNLDMKELKKSGEKAGGYVFSLSLVADGLIAAFRKQLDITETLTPKVVFILIILNLIGALFLFLYVNAKAYPRKQRYELATNEEFNEAFVSNIYFTFNKKTVFKDKWIDVVSRSLFGIFLIVLGLIFPLILFEYISAVLGIISIPACMPCTGVGLIIIFLYNSGQYLKVENLYHEHKIIFKEGQR